MSSPISVSIQKDSREVSRMLRNLKGGADKVITRALNKTIRPVERVALKSIAKDLRLPQKAVKKSVTRTRATWRRKRAVIEASGVTPASGVGGVPIRAGGVSPAMGEGRLPIKLFGARQTRRGVTYKARGGGRKLIPGAFIATMSNGHKGVFMRRGRKRLPIVELYGPSIPTVFVRKHVQRAMDNEADASWSKNLNHELSWLIRNA